MQMRASMYHRSLGLMVALLLGVLTACGEYVPQGAQLSAVEERQTSLALAGQPTLEPQIQTIQALPTPTPLPISEIFAISDDDPRALGDPAAPILFVEFTDFECPFCSRFVADTKQALIDRFVESGQVRFVVRDLPLENIHPSAVPAAIAARCAADQDAYFAMYDRLFSTHQIEWGGVPRRDREVFVEFAADLGLDTAQFRACQDDPAVEATVRAEADQVSRLGFNATPSFFVNQRRLSGALGVEVFSDLIEIELRALSAQDQ